MNSLIEKWKELGRPNLTQLDEQPWYDFDEYVNLFERKLHPSMFIPWDKENSCPLEKPKLKSIHNEPRTEDYEKYKLDCEKYQQAESEVIFEGFGIIQEDGYEYIYHDKIGCLFGFNIPNNKWILLKHKTIEDIHKQVELKK